MIRFRNETNHDKVIRAIHIAEKALHPDGKSTYIKAVRLKHDWKYNPTKMDGNKIADKMLTHSADILPVYMYNSGGNAQAAYEKGKIFLDERYVSRASEYVIAATLVHELLHYKGFQHRSGLFGMTSNFPSEDKYNYNINYWTTRNLPYFAECDDFLEST